MNTALLKQIQDRILKHPHNFNMRNWFLPACDEQGGDCGTAACVAGWAVTIHCDGTQLPLNRHDFDARKEGMHLLELDEHEADRLFYANNWPKQFRTDYLKAQTHLCRAKAAVARIDHFIKTGGK